MEKYYSMEVNTYMHKKRADHENGIYSPFIYVTDEELMKLLKSKGYSFIESGVNESTREIYWKYERSDEIIEIIYPVEHEKKLQKYSLDRWKLCKFDNV